MITDKNLSNLAQYGKTQALQTYATRLIETRRLLKLLDGFAKKGHDVDLAQVGWDHIGDLGHVNTLLAGLVKFLDIEE